MGKTTLWRAGVESGERPGSACCRRNPSRARRLSFAGVGDLLDPVLEDALVPLPARQRRALSRALASRTSRGPLEPRTLRVALLNALRTLAER